VSYVLNGRDTESISERTARAVRRAAADLDYRPNPFAQSLKRGRGGTVLFPLPGAAMNLVVAEAVDACAAALAERGLTLVTDSTQYGAPGERADAWMRLHPAAVIDVFVAPDDPAIAPLLKGGVVVLTSTPGGQSGESAAESIAHEARRTELAYLLEQGHKRILLAGQPAIDRRNEQRLRSDARAACKAAGASFEVHRAPLTRAGVSGVADRWMASTGRADAISASNDEFALALLGALAARGVRVPDDVAVIGVDDIPLAAAATPSLTTVAADFGPWGEAIAARVHDLLKGESTTGPLPPLATRVVVRESA
jgi:DNA-binding LacI/PurR family transcriptional regulator